MKAEDTRGLGGESAVYEGLRVRLAPAPFSKRFLAYSIDLGVVLAVIYPLSLGVFLVLMVITVTVLKFVIGDGRETASELEQFFVIGVGALFLIALLGILMLQHLYFVYFEFKRGTTPGKKIFGLRVVSLDGGALTLGQAILRDLLRYVDCFMVLPGVISTLLSEKRRRLGDLLAQTMVVYSAAGEGRAERMYMSSEDYRSLLGMLKPVTISNELCSSFLSFAFKRYGLRSTKIPEGEVERWRQAVEGYFQSDASKTVDNETKLRFFAEYCFQLSKGEKTK